MRPIECQGLEKTYDNGTEALRGLDLQVEPGEIFCLVGENGAGKTTLVRIIATQLEPSAGTIRILGFDAMTHADEVRRRIASVPQEAWPDHALMVWEQIYYYLRARGESRAEAWRACRKVTESLGLSDRLEHRVSSLSGGMRRRVLLCMALASRADVLLLDEPTAGLDLMIRRETWRFLAQCRERMTLVLTTHSMEEAEALATRVGIMGNGELLAVGTPEELRALVPGREKVLIDEASLPRELLATLGSTHEMAGKWAVYPRERAALRRLLDITVERGVEASVLRTTLEDVFVHLLDGDGRASSPVELR